jgi:glycosyltransferase involved in cell wall biosynthesis
VNFVSRITLRYADFTIVSNRELVPLVSECKGKALILPDPYPQVEDYLGSSPPLPAATFTIFCVASWSDDEPLDAYVAAARTLSNIKFIISGNPRGRDIGILQDLPANVECTGFLSEREYYRAMASSQGVIAFSSRRATLVCGGYEAVVLGKPFITGNSSALRSHFEAALFSDGSPADLVDKIISMQNNYSEQQKKVRQFHRDSDAKWQNIFEGVKNQIFVPIQN